MQRDHQYKTKSILLLFAISITGIFFTFNCGNTIDHDSSFINNSIPEVVDFNFHVRPILSDRCYACHGPDENTRGANLRLDLESEAFKESSEEPGKFAIIKGDTTNSLLIKRIFNHDPAQMMPPPESNLLLEDHEKEILKRWVHQGANWKTHWSFIPPVKAELPKVKNQEIVNNEIDHFILSRLDVAVSYTHLTLPTICSV